MEGLSVLDHWHSTSFSYYSSSSSPIRKHSKSFPHSMLLHPVDSFRKSQTISLGIIILSFPLYMSINFKKCIWVRNTKEIGETNWVRRKANTHFRFGNSSTWRKSCCFPSDQGSRNVWMSRVYTSPGKPLWSKSKVLRERMWTREREWEDKVVEKKRYLSTREVLDSEKKREFREAAHRTAKLDYHEEIFTLVDILFQGIYALFNGLFCNFHNF